MHTCVFLDAKPFFVYSSSLLRSSLYLSSPFVCFCLRELLERVEEMVECGSKD